MTLLKFSEPPHLFATRAGTAPAGGGAFSPCGSRRGGVGESYRVWFLRRCRELGVDRHIMRAYRPGESYGRLSWFELERWRQQLCELREDDAARRGANDRRPRRRDRLDDWQRAQVVRTSEQQRRDTPGADSWVVTYKRGASRYEWRVPQDAPDVERSVAALGYLVAMAETYAPRYQMVRDPIPNPQPRATYVEPRARRRPVPIPKRERLRALIGAVYVWGDYLHAPAGLCAPASLRGLAKHFGVSVGEVRAAVSVARSARDRISLT